jgi:hypothetical protein
MSNNSGQIQIDSSGHITSSGTIKGAKISLTGNGQRIDFDSGRILIVTPQNDGTVRYSDTSPSGIKEEYIMSSSGEGFNALPHKFSWRCANHR